MREIEEARARLREEAWNVVESRNRLADAAAKVEDEQSRFAEERSALEEAKQTLEVTPGPNLTPHYIAGCLCRTCPP